MRSRAPPHPGLFFFFWLTSAFSSVDLPLDWGPMTATTW